MYTYLHTYIHICMYTYIYTYVYMYLCKSVYMHMFYMCIYICTYAYAYIHIHIYMYIIYIPIYIYSYMYVFLGGAFGKCSEMRQLLRTLAAFSLDGKRATWPTRARRHTARFLGIIALVSSIEALNTPYLGTLDPYLQALRTHILRFFGPKTI